MASGPFVFPFHTSPIASFWAEWWAAASGLAAAVVGLYAARERLALPSLLLVPAVLLLALLVQYMAGRLVFVQAGLLYAVYLLWACLLLILGRALVDTIGLARVADVLAAAIAVGALIGAAIALVQWLGIGERVMLVLNKGGSIFGNLGQRNQHTHFSWIGIVSAFYLHGRDKLSRRLFWFLVLSIGFGSVLGGSRSVFLYWAVLMAVLAWLRRREPQGRAAGLFVDGLILLPVLGGLNLIGYWATPRIPGFWMWFATMAPWMDHSEISAGNYSMPGARLYEEVSGSSVRLAILRAAWSAFVETPWLGQGAGNYPWASFVAAVGRRGDEQFIVMEHAHNVVFQLLAEFGVPATVAVVLPLCFWAKRFIGQAWKLEHFWCASILGIGAAHSLLEYPLWYSYFLGLAALLLGATDDRRAAELAGRRISLYLGLIALAGAVILGNLRSDYSKIEAAYNYPLAAHPDRERAWRISMDRLLVLYRESLLSPWVLMAFVNLAQPSTRQAQERADLCERGIRFAPVRSLATRCAMQLAIAGRKEDARKLAQDVLHAFPEERRATADELRKGARTFPEIEPLLALIPSR